MPDCNKTQLTREVTNSASLWLDERGFKPVESEVGCDRKWIADLASFCYPTRTEAVKMRLIKRQPQYRKEGWREQYAKWDSEFLSLPSPLTALVEVKTTVQDFKRDDKFSRSAPVNLLYVAIPNGLLEPSQIDARWGILVQIKSGVVKCIRQPKLQHVSVDRTVHILAQIAIRRHHFSAYDRAREFQKQASDNENERTSRMRIGTAVNMVTSIVSGKRTVEDAIAVYCGRVKLPKWQIEELNKLCSNDSNKTRMYHGVEWAD